MIARIVNLEIENAYAALKSALDGKGCRLVVDEVPTHVVIQQGSLWGVTPQDAKKTVRYDLTPVDSGTQIMASSKISSDWTKTAVGGCALAVLLAFICFWIGMDLEFFIASGQSTYWSWLVTANGYSAIQFAQSFANLVRLLAVFLLVVTILEGAVVAYAHSKADKFAEESLNYFI